MDRKHTKNQTRKRKGGKYIFQGTYGCGMAPGLLCKGETEKNRNTAIFSKIMRKNTANDEFKIASTLKKIDPDEQYLLYPKQMCNINASKLANSNNIEKCTSVFNGRGRYNIIQNLSKNDTDFTTIRYSEGGKDLLNIYIPLSDYYIFFRDLVQLFEGLVLLHSRNFVHLDIKEPNVVCHKNTENSYLFHYIDFGLSQKTELTPNSIFVKTNYKLWPFDLIFLRNVEDYKYAIRNRFYNSLIDHINKTKNKKEEIRTVFIRYNESIERDTASLSETEKTKYYITHPYMINEYINEHMEYSNKYIDKSFRKSLNPEVVKDMMESLETASDMEVNDLLLKATDVFSLGLLLNDIFMRNIQDTKVRNNEKLVVPYFSLVNDMLSPYLGRRLTAEEALERYKGLLPIFQEIMSIETKTEKKTPKQIQNSELFGMSPSPLVLNTRKNTRKNKNKKN